MTQQPLSNLEFRKILNGTNLLRISNFSLQAARFLSSQKETANASKKTACTHRCSHGEKAELHLASLFSLPLRYDEIGAGLEGHKEFNQKIQPLKSRLSDLTYRIQNARVKIEIRRSDNRACSVVEACIQTVLHLGQLSDIYKSPNNKQNTVLIHSLKESVSSSQYFILICLLVRYFSSLSIVVSPLIAEAEAYERE